MLCFYVSVPVFFLISITKFVNQGAFPQWKYLEQPSSADFLRLQTRRGARARGIRTHARTSIQIHKHERKLEDALSQERGRVFARL